MFLTLLLIVQVGSDWVEISQQHYRKPLRVTHNLPALSNVSKIEEHSFEETTQKNRFFDDSTTKNRLYLNQSIADYHRNRGVLHKVPNIGSVERVFVSTEDNHKTVKIVNIDRFDESLNLKPIKVTKLKTGTDTDTETDLSSGKKINKEKLVMVNDIKNKDDMKLPIENIDTIKDQLHAQEVKGPDISEAKTKQQETSESVTNNTKANTFENIVKFLKVVADTITKNTRKSVNSKVKYLHNLKNSILANIEERLESAWPEPREAAPTRRRRRNTAREHVQFPSSESTLMTISFLTFAVFLIKLVLQVIQTYKSKTMMMAPAVVAMGRAVNVQTMDN